jgi:6-pyruvoyltetrahydropterin/6-carboxytetrahydropterin synthase
MVNLSREIRFALLPPEQIGVRKFANTWSGWPSGNLLAPQLILTCQISGAVDPQTGYLCNIKVIDDLLQGIVLEKLIPAFLKNPLQTPVHALLRLAYQSCLDRWKDAPDPLPRIEQMRLSVSPYLSYSIIAEDSTMMQLTQQFEFSAAHRLNCSGMSEAENRAYFGKCNNPHGHGHNYVVDVSVSAEDGQLDVHRLEKLVKELVIDRLDHTHLNEDDPYFAVVNPSVENIAAAIFSWLQEPVQPYRLRRIRVYETPKTWAEWSA